jgi:hypothetical protein
MAVHLAAAENLAVLNMNDAFLKEIVRYAKTWEER